MISKEEKFRPLVYDNKGKLLRICKYYSPSIENQKDKIKLIFINTNIPGQPYPGIL
jgi:hypothetical protein